LNDVSLRERDEDMNRLPGAPSRLSLIALAVAGALAGSLPLVILYAFFVEHYVSAMTGAVKE